MRAICIHDTSGVDDNSVRDAVRRSRASTDPRLVGAFFNSEKGQLFLEWDATSLDPIMRIHEELNLAGCPGPTPVEELKEAA